MMVSRSTGGPGGIPSGGGGGGSTMNCKTQRQSCHNMKQFIYDDFELFDQRNINFQRHACHI